MFRFFQNAKRSLDSLLNLITDLVADGLLFFRLLFCSRTALSAEVLFLRKQLAFYKERQIQPRRLKCGFQPSVEALTELVSSRLALPTSQIEAIGQTAIAVNVQEIDGSRSPIVRVFRRSDLELAGLASKQK